MTDHAMPIPNMAFLRSDKTPRLAPLVATSRRPGCAPTCSDSVRRPAREPVLVEVRVVAILMLSRHQTPTIAGRMKAR